MSGWKRGGYLGDSWTRENFEIRVVGETSTGKPIQWGIWKDGEEVTGPMSKHTKKPQSVRFTRVRDAKRKVDLALVNRKLFREVACRACGGDGFGTVMAYPCPVCRGDGRVQERTP